MCTSSSLTSSLKVAHQSLISTCVFFCFFSHHSTFHYWICSYFICIVFYFIYPLLLECKYHESRELACFRHCCILWAWNSSWHITDASCAHFLNEYKAAQFLVYSKCIILITVLFYIQTTVNLHLPRPVFPF